MTRNSWGIRELNQMRFEIGDTMVEGEKETCALSDEEYLSIISTREILEKGKAGPC